MNPDELRNRFACLQIWESEGKRAPHKPLLALWAIARCLRGEDRMASYRDVEYALKNLLERFGPPRKRVHPEYPFGRLQKDGIWQVQSRDDITKGPGGDFQKSSLLEQDAHGGFPDDIYAALRTDKALAVEIAFSLIDAHFPTTLHDDVLEAVGILELEDGDIGSRFEYVQQRHPAAMAALAEAPGSRFEHVRRRHRDSAFSKNVLAAYGHQCAVCAFAVRLKGAHVALEAAHIQWHGANGPDDIPNGLALCALHHRLFDTGAFTVLTDWRVEVAEAADGEGFDDSLGRFHTQSLLLPASDDHRPHPEFLKWHRREVFRLETSTKR